jgi:hypothetical protein
MGTEQMRKRDILAAIRPKLEEAFNQLDDIAGALAPDVPCEVMEAWNALYDLMTPEFIVARDKMRGDAA